MAETKTIVNLEKELDIYEKENGRYDPKIKEIEGRIATRATKITKLQQDRNTVDDEIYQDFCKEIKVANIRVYEERELAGQQQNVKERMVFEEKRTRLNTQLEFEMSRDTLKSYNRWDKEMKDYDKELTSLRTEEELLSKAIKEIEDKIEVKKGDIEKFRSVSEDIGNEIDEMKKKLSAKNKEINDFRKKINSVEAKLMDKKLERHGILKNSKIELIELPMLRGSMNDISDEDHLPAQTQKSTSDDTVNSSAVNTESLNSIATNDQNEMFEKEARIKINYKKLDTDFLNVKIVYFF